MLVAIMVDSVFVAWQMFAAVFAKHRAVFLFADAFGPVAIDCIVH